MPWADLLPYIGISGTLLMTLLPFWKADDLISQAARDDVSNFILKIDYNIKISTRNVTRYFFNAVFRNNYFSIRVIFISLVFKVLISFYSVEFVKIFITNDAIIELELFVDKYIMSELSDADGELYASKFYEALEGSPLYRFSKSGLFIDILIVILIINSIIDLSVTAKLDIF